MRVRAADVAKLADGENVELLGWLRSKRIHGKLLFLDLRDSTGIIQVTVRTPQVAESDFSKAASVGRESALRVVGSVKHDPRAPGGVEVSASKVEVVSPSLEEYPLKKGVSSRVLSESRHLAIRGPKASAVLRFRSKLINQLRDWFEREGFVEVHCPTFITAAVEGGATLFKVDYFGRPVYLTQSVQFYQEAAIYALEKVYSVQPSFRAERSKTRRHLTEFWHVEGEMAFAGLEELMRVVERLVGESSIAALENSADELRLLDRKVNVSSLEPPYERVKYSEALGLLERKGVHVPWGSDLGADEERVLTMEFEKPFFLTHFPKKAKAFYHKTDPSNPQLTLSADLLAPAGYGEIVGGGQRIHDYEELLGRIEEEGLDASDYRWYLDLRKFGSVPHSGFGLGLERLVQWLLGLKNIRSAAMFPRTPTRVYP
ncbi:MAG: asparagine--tRNA ligase [Candidatus Caldarchaeum sp.]|nr:asparagine--tRNA ligase [Candidatus Caldarchaeum sp.]